MKNGTALPLLRLPGSAYNRRVERFLNELVWMARALRYGRENLPEE